MTRADFLSGAEAMLEEQSAIYPPHRRPVRFIVGTGTKAVIDAAAVPAPKADPVMTSLFGSAVSQLGIPIHVDRHVDPDAAYAEMSDGAIVDLRRRREVEPETEDDGGEE